MTDVDPVTVGDTVGYECPDCGTLRKTTEQARAHCALPSAERAQRRFAERCREAGLDDRRFIDVRDGEKGTRTPRHQNPENWLAPDSPDLAGNYGVHPGPGRDESATWLVEFDIDDYDREHDRSALDKLPETLAVKSPHTEPDDPGHRYYAVTGDVAAALREVAGNLNPEPVWGEVKSKGKYVVGPGSQLDGCTKEWCDECADPVGGYYAIAVDVPIATITTDDLTDVLRDDPNIQGRTGGGTDHVLDENGEIDRRGWVGDEAEPPEDLPMCYRAALTARGGGASVSKHKVNVYIGLLGLNCGYEVHEVTDHISEVDPGIDRSETEYHLEHIQNNRYSPPALKTLARAGILSAPICYGECPIHGDEGNSGEGNGEGPREPFSALPLDQLDALRPEERKRAARKRGLEWPTTDALRDRLRDRILDAAGDKEDVVIPAPTGAGKSFTVATEQWRELEDVTGGAPVIHLHETREARDSAALDTEEYDGDGGVLLGRSEACAVARGDHDPDEAGSGEHVITIDGQPASEWFDAVCDGKGVPFSAAHQYLDEYNDQQTPLPCCPPADDNGARYECGAIRQWNGVPRNDEGEPALDIVHATHNFANVPGLIQDSIVVIDEQPDYTVELSQDRVRRAITAYLDEIGAPVTTFEAFVSLARVGDSAYGTDAGVEASAVAERLATREPAREWYLTDPDAHTLAPAIARAIWYALRDEPDGNGRVAKTVPHELPRLDAHAHDDESWNREWVTVVLDEENTVRRIRAAPDLSGTHCVIGLNAHPTTSLWQLNTRPDIHPAPFLEPEERRLWRRFERGLTVVQVGEHTRPAGKDGKYAKRDRGREPFIRHLREHYGSRFATAITDSHSETQLRNLMLDAGVDAERVGTMHYGEEKSRNDFAGESVGAVLGCIDAGDDYVLDALAELGLDARPETDVDEDGEEFRAYGREFTGPDADTAAALVASVRENHVAQAAGRYARDADDPEDVATVFVRTDALPVGFADYQVAGVTHVAGDKQRAIAEALREQPGATARELRELVSDRLPGDETVSKSHVTKTLAAFLERGTIQRWRGSGAYGADQWDGDNLTDAAATGDVDLGEVQDRVLSLLVL